MKEGRSWSDFIYTKNSAIGRSDFIYTKNSARLRYDCIYTKSFLRKIAKHQWYSQNFPWRKSWQINDIFKNPWSTFMNPSPSESEACHGKSTTDFARGSACHGKRSEDLARVSTCHIWNEFQNSFQPYIQVHLLELLGKTVFGWGRCDWKWRFSNRKTAFAGIHFLHYGWVSAIPWPQVH